MAPWKVLVIDDDADIRRIAALSLGRLGGWRVVVASCAEDGLAEVARDRPDLVLLDVSMPGTDGPATIEALHALAGAETLPVIFFTATSSEAEVARLKALGAVGVLAKPFDVAELPRQVRALGAAAGLRTP